MAFRRPGLQEENEIPQDPEEPRQSITVSVPRPQSPIPVVSLTATLFPVSGAVNRSGKLSGISCPHFNSTPLDVPCQGKIHFF
jgi:hypothetical protein